MTLPAEINAAFFARIEQWRESLAHHIARRNPALADRQLNYAVQITLDRILFLRLCEERGSERRGQLIALLHCSEVYRRLLTLFRKADGRYKLGLFCCERRNGRSGVPDELTPKLVIDDEPLKDILRSLYYPESPFEFSVLPAEILGPIYERFLGKGITRTADPGARIQDKPGRRKAGGIFYTPGHIVDYIVTRTVGKLLEGCTVLSHQTRLPRLDRPLRVLDPACGCGSFLLGAYQHLLDWYLAYYEQHEPDTWAAAKIPPIYQAGARGWRLTLAERQRILLDHIYGVDLDPQAVDVTKRSFLLKILEGQSDARVPALPDLAGNIKCGNALIGSDFFEGRPPAASERVSQEWHGHPAREPLWHRHPADDSWAGSPCHEEPAVQPPSEEQERRRINPFDWPTEFPAVFQDGGFDAVIGNPPWGQKEIDIGDDIRDYLRKTYVSLAGIMDVFRPFVEKSIHLLAPNGLCGMVLPDVVLLKNYPDTRLLLLRNLCLNDICWWGMAFGNAVIDAATVVGRKGCATDGQSVHVRIADREPLLEHEIPQSDFLANPRYTFNLYLTPAKRALLHTLNTLPKLGDFFEVHEGVHSGNMRAELFVDRATDNTCKPLYFGRNEIAPYRLQWNGRHVCLGAVPGKHNGEKYANLGRRHWHERPKVLVRRTGDHVLAAVDAEGLYASNNFFLVFPRSPCGLDLYGLCALLNSRFTTWYFRCLEPRRGRAFAELKIKHLRVFPLPNGPDRQGTDHELNLLGRARTLETARLADPLSPNPSGPHRTNLRDIDARIDACVLSSLGLPADFRDQIT